MLQKIHALLERQFVRYVLVGGSAYVIEMAVILVALKAGTSNVLAVALSFWIGLTYSFILQKFFSFGDKRTHHKLLLKQAALVGCLVAFNFLFTIAVTAALQSILPAVVTRTLAIGATTLWNFYLYKTRIFKPAIID